MAVNGGNTLRRSLSPGPTRSSGGTREPTLRPVRRPRPPGARAVLRAVLVAALLVLAAGVLYTREPTSCPAPTGALPSDEPAPAGPVPGGPTPTRLALPPGLVGVPVRLAEPAALAVLRPGARVDLLAAPASGEAGGPTLLAPRALVLDVVGAGSTDGFPALYLALQPDQAHTTAGMPENTRFMIIVR